MNIRDEKRLDAYGFETQFQATSIYWKSGVISVMVPLKKPVYLHWDGNEDGLWEVNTHDGRKLTYPEVKAFLHSRI